MMNKRSMCNYQWMRHTQISYQWERTSLIIMLGFQSWEVAIICAVFVLYLLQEVESVIDLWAQSLMRLNTWEMKVLKKLHCLDRMSIVITISLKWQAIKKYSQRESILIVQVSQRHLNLEMVWESDLLSLWIKFQMQHQKLDSGSLHHTQKTSQTLF